MSTFVSIHAPARGATDGERLSVGLGCVSIHAPARGATRPKRHLHSSEQFQFTLPRGERQFHIEAIIRLIEFQFTLPRGERPSTNLSHPNKNKFQFTLPRGERPLWSVPKASYQSFNSRSREGSDAGGVTYACQQGKVSIHAPARGATKVTGWSGSYIRFQFTLPRGERHRSASEESVRIMFQFTLPRGERQAIFYVERLAQRFQFTLPRGERLPSRQRWT